MSRKILLLIGLLVLAAFVYAQDEPTIEAGGDIALGDVVSGEFAPGARVQYTLEIEENLPINIYLDGGDESMDTVLRVYLEGEEEPLAENDDRGDGSLFSALDALEVEAGDVIIIEVATFGDEGEGDYQLRVTEPATINDAGTIELGDEAAGELDENSRQRYIVEVEDDSVLDIELASEIDTYLRLYREGEDTPVAQNNDLVPGENTSSGFNGLVIPAGTTLVLEAAALGDASAGDYNLSVSESEIEAAEAAQPILLDEETTPAGLCEGAETLDEPARLQYIEAADSLEAGVDYGAVFCTEAGAFLIDLFEEEAPIAVNSFVHLATNHFFDNTTFHRVIEDFVVQGGDPTATGSGGPGYEFVNETDNDLTFGGIGVLGMANAGPDTNGSQFFVTLAPVARLDGGYTIFGQVQQGMAAVTDVEVRDPGTAEEPGTALYTVIIVTFETEEE